MLFEIGQMSASAGYALGIAVAMLFFYLVLRPMHLRYYRDKRQILRRRIWFREERARLKMADDHEALGRLGRWHNPELTIQTVTDSRRGLILTFRNDPPTFYRNLKRVAVIRPDAADSNATRAEVMLPSFEGSYPVLKVLLPKASKGYAKEGDTFRFADNFN